MKKILATLLALIMALSMLPINALAADKIQSIANDKDTAYAIGLNQEKTFNMYYGCFNPVYDEEYDYWDYEYFYDYSVYYAFTPSVSGYYQVELKSLSSKGLNSYVAHFEDTYSPWIDDVKSGTAVEAAYLSAGVKYIIWVRADIEEPEYGQGNSATFSIVVKNHTHVYGEPEDYLNEHLWLRYTCKVCGYYYEESMINCPHTNTSIVGLRYPTATEIGYTGDVWCNDCATIITAGEESWNICSHQNVEVRGAYAATCTSEGFTGNKYCTTCNLSLGGGEKTAPLNHSSTYISGARSANCFDGGYTGDTYCAYCSQYLSGGYSTAKTKPTLSSVKSSAKKASTVKWKKVAGASGYEVQYSTKSNMKSAKKVTIKKGSTTSTTIKKLTSKKKIYVRIRAYKLVGGKKVYSSWSSVKNVKVK